MEIGEETLQEFYVKWQENFERQEEDNMVKIQELEQQHDQQMDMLNEKLGRAVEAAKIKPDAKLRVMQHNEKLVAVNERIEEAGRQSAMNDETPERGSGHELGIEVERIVITGQVGESLHIGRAERASQ